MGLDGVELVMNVEEAFGISIDDHAACEMRTVGQLHDYVLAKVMTDRSAVCMTSAAFYKVRQGICKALQVDRGNVRPSTPIDQVLGNGDYPRQWRKLRGAIDVRIVPRLARPTWLSLLIESPGLWLVVAIGLTGALYLMVPAAFGLLIFPLICLELLAGLSLYAFGDPLARVLPRDFATVGDLSRVVLAKNYQWFLARQTSWSAPDLWERLRSIISETLAVDRASVTPESRFIEDLKLS